MPLDGRAAFQLGLLVLAVPAQYFITSYISTDEASRSSAIRKLVSGAAGFKDQYLTWKTWRQWCLDIVRSVKGFTLTDEQSDAPPTPSTGESPAVEVLRFRDRNGHFASSPDPRSPRPTNVKYRVGQVIKHKRWGYRGIIVGWDEQARAPEHWLQQMHPPDKPHWRTQPNYSVLVDTRDRLSPQTTYIPQENIEIVTNVQVIHPEIDQYFEAFDGAQYLARPWLKALYPRD